MEAINRFRRRVVGYVQRLYNRAFNNDVRRPGPPPRPPRPPTPTPSPTPVDMETTEDRESKNRETEQRESEKRESENQEPKPVIFHKVKINGKKKFYPGNEEGYEEGYDDKQVEAEELMEEEKKERAEQAKRDALAEEEELMETLMKDLAKNSKKNYRWDSDDQYKGNRHNRLSHYRLTVHYPVFSVGSKKSHMNKNLKKRVKNTGNRTLFVKPDETEKKTENSTPVVESDESANKVENKTPVVESDESAMNIENRLPVVESNENAQIENKTPVVESNENAQIENKTPTVESNEHGSPAHLAANSGLSSSLDYRPLPTPHRRARADDDDSEDYGSSSSSSSSGRNSAMLHFMNANAAQRLQAETGGAERPRFMASAATAIPWVPRGRAQSRNSGLPGSPPLRGGKRY